MSKRQQLRDYQIKADAEIDAAFDAGHKSVLLVLPTGGGKTSVAAHIIHKTEAAEKYTMFVAHRKELIEQCSARLDAQGVEHGIIKAGNKRVNNRLVQVASIQTLINRVRPRDGQLIGHSYRADLIIIDEAHRALAGTYLDAIKGFPEARILGLTATPYRSDGKGLGDLFDVIVSASSPAELTGAGYLVPARAYTTPLEPDFAKMRVKMGEFDKQAIEQAMNNADLVGDVFAQWKKHADTRQTVIFASSCAHGKSIVGVFKEKGVAAEYLDGETPEDIRSKMLFDLEKGLIQVVVNMGVLTEGWDCPVVSCVVLARPTKSLGLYLQMAGRALRPSPGKLDCIIIDHGGNVMRHGLVTEERSYSLEGDKGRADQSKTKTCFACRMVHDQYKCPSCGHVNKKPKPTVTKDEQSYMDDLGIVEADLEEIDINKLLARRKGELEFLRAALAEQANRGFKPGYAKKMFMQKYNRWPGKELGMKPIWGANYSGGPPQGYRFEGVEYLENRGVNAVP